MKLCEIARLAGFVLWFAPTLFAEPPVIDDLQIVRKITQSTGESADRKEGPSADALAKSAKKSSRMMMKTPLPEAPATAPGNNYESLSRSVYLLATVYKCGKCEKWHQGGNATAWCLADDGLMVTNAHVFLNAKGGAMGVSDRDGNCFPVTELLAIDAAADIAIFRVKASGLQPLKLGETAEVGAPVTVISHPAGNLFLRTSGAVSRYSKRQMAKNQAKVTWMAITADYGKGSSGGPVFNHAGEVVGMVSSTRSIYADPAPSKSKKSSPGALQMVIKSCVPVSAIRGLFRESGTGTVATEG